MTVENYIEGCLEERRTAMETLRTMLLKAFPHLEESMLYKMPTYSLEGQKLFAFASQKHYMAFYVCHYDLLVQLSDVTDKYNCGKSCIRFKHVDTEVVKDLKKIAKFVYKHLDESQFKA